MLLLAFIERRGVETRLPSGDGRKRRPPFD